MSESNKKTSSKSIIMYELHTKLYVRLHIKFLFSVKFCGYKVPLYCIRKIRKTFLFLLYINNKHFIATKLYDKSHFRSNSVNIVILIINKVECYD